MLSLLVPWREVADSAGDWPCVWLGATYIKVRQCGRVSSAATTVAVGANTEGRREVGGLRVGLSETESFRSELPRAALTNAGARSLTRCVEAELVHSHPEADLLARG